MSNSQTKQLLPVQQLRSHEELDPSHAQVILYDSNRSHLVLYHNNEIELYESRNVNINRERITRLSNNNNNNNINSNNRWESFITYFENINNSDNSNDNICPLCQQSLSNMYNISDNLFYTRPKIRRDYFAILDKSHSRRSNNNNVNNNVNNNINNKNINNIDEVLTRNNSSKNEIEEEKERLADHSFLNNYYETLFSTVKKLGSGSYGQVFLCNHVLSGISIGSFAVKIVAVGNIRRRLLDILREVKALQKLHHRNIINYNHAWLQYYQPAITGPKVPCLFILMEFADRGNLMDYILNEEDENDNKNPILIEIERRKKLKRNKKLNKNNNKNTIDTKNNISHPPINSSNFKKIKLNDDLYSKRRWLSEYEIWTIVFETCMGLQHLHKHGIVHRDLKPGNLLLISLVDKDKIKFNGSQFYNLDYRIVISDLGQSDFLDLTERRPRTGDTGTSGFAAPELSNDFIKNKKQNNKNRKFNSTINSSDSGNNSSSNLFSILNSWDESVDIWSLGHILYFLSFSVWPYENMFSSESQLYLNIKKGLKLEIPTNHKRSPLLIEMIEKLTHTNPLKRPQLKEVISKISTTLRFMKYTYFNDSINNINSTSKIKLRKNKSINNKNIYPRQAFPLPAPVSLSDPNRFAVILSPTLQNIKNNNNKLKNKNILIVSLISNKKYVRLFNKSIGIVSLITQFYTNDILIYLIICYGLISINLLLSDVLSNFYIKIRIYCIYFHIILYILNIIFNRFNYKSLIFHLIIWFIQFISCIVSNYNNKMNKYKLN